MTKRSRHLLLLVAVAGLVALVVAGWLLWPRSAITRENAAKIEDGMTLAEVEAILGGPMRDEASGPVTPDAPASRGAAWLPDQRPFWRSDEVTILVIFSRDGRVERYPAIPTRRIHESPIEVVRRWLGL